MVSGLGSRGWAWGLKGLGFRVGDQAVEGCLCFGFRGVEFRL